MSGGGLAGIGHQADGDVVRVIEIPAGADANTFHSRLARWSFHWSRVGGCRHRYFRYHAPRWWRRWHQWTCIRCRAVWRVR